MSSLIFLFNLDSIVTRREIIPFIAEKCDMSDDIRELMQISRKGEIPFKQDFIQKVDVLKQIPVSKINDIVADIELGDAIVEFIRENKERCFIVTENLDVWLRKMLSEIGMEQNIFCSKAIVKDDFIQSVFSVVDKNDIINQMVVPFVAIGNGNNDAAMIEAAEIGIGYGGVQEISSSVIACATHVVYDEAKLVDFLNKLI